MRNILFYKYVEIADPEAFQEEHLAFCLELELLGKVLVAKEGINGCVSGSDESIARYKEILTKDPRFTDVTFKERDVPKHTFKKMFVRVRKEIVTLGVDDVDLKDKARYIEPEALKQLYESGEEFYIIDARNNYESKVGKFAHAITPDIDTFREWPQAVEKFKHLKDKKVVTYCTGGIRCEKASAYLKEQGFKDVSQLHGGIIRYGDVVGGTHWEGKCFVFDKRVLIEVDPAEQTEPITRCELCNIPEDMYYNCKRNECDRRFIACKNCFEVLEGCCSKRCRNLN